MESCHEFTARGGWRSSQTAPEDSEDIPGRLSEDDRIRNSWSQEGVERCQLIDMPRPLFRGFRPCLGVEPEDSNAVTHSIDYRSMYQHRWQKKGRAGVLQPAPDSRE